MRKGLLILLSLCFCLACQGQGRNILLGIDHVLERLQGGKNLDSNYVRNPDERWRVKLRTDFVETVIGTSGADKGGAFTSEFYTRPRVREGISLAYRGLSLGLSQDISNKAKDGQSYSFKLYGQTFNFEMEYISDRSFRGHAVSEYGESDLPYGLVDHRSLNIDAYYFLNGNRFSFPAAISQSKFQLRSAGSWIAAASYRGGWTSTDAYEQIQYPKTSIIGRSIGIGMGYGYNHVQGRWLLHASFIPTLIIFDNSQLTLGDQTDKIHYGFLNSICSTNLLAVYNFSRYFAGMSVVLHNASIGSQSQFRSDYLRARARIYIGIRL